MFDGVENGFLSLPTKFCFITGSMECRPIFVVVSICIWYNIDNYICAPSFGIKGDNLIFCVESEWGETNAWL